jgi:hypothetical protein
MTRLLTTLALTCKAAQLDNLPNWHGTVKDISAVSGSTDSIGVAWCKICLERLWWLWILLELLVGWIALNRFIVVPFISFRRMSLLS